MVHIVIIIYIYIHKDHILTGFEIFLKVHIIIIIICGYDIL